MDQTDYQQHARERKHNRGIRLFIYLQLIGFVCAILASVIQIETIAASGPLLSIFGICFSFICLLRRLPLCMFLGLGPVAVSTLCYLIVRHLQLEPGPAYVPINAVLLLFGLAAMLLGSFALRESRHRPFVSRQFKFQFRIVTLLGLTTLVAILIPLLRTRNPYAISIAILGAYGAIFIYLQRLFKSELDTEAILASTTSEDEA